MDLFYVSLNQLTVNLHVFLLFLRCHGKNGKEHVKTFAVYNSGNIHLTNANCQ